MKKNVMNLVDSILSVREWMATFLGLSKDDELTIRKLVKIVKRQFEHDMDQYVGERVIQFPMVFDILLCPEDYDRLKFAVPGILPELIADFYEIIKSKKEERGPKAIVMNINKYWLFTYSASAKCSDGKGGLREIEKGEVIVVSSLCSVDVRLIEKEAVMNNRSSVSSVSSTKKGAIGSLAGTAINLNVLSGGTIHSNKSITFDYDPKLNADMDIIESSRSTREALAILAWESEKTGKQSDIPFVMEEKTIIISGPEDQRANPSGIMKIDDDLVKQDHAHIRYVDTTKKFEICAFYDGVRLNQIPVPVSNGQNEQWVELPKKSTIIIRNYVTIKFMAS